MYVFTYWGEIVSMKKTTPSNRCEPKLRLSLEATAATKSTCSAMHPLKLLVAELC
jgi:hypothetical protein